MDSTQNELLKPPQVAKELGICTQSVRELVKKGFIKGIYVKKPGSKQGSYYIYRKSVEEFKNGGMPLEASAANTTQLQYMMSEMSRQMRASAELTNQIVAAMGLKGGTHENAKIT